MFDIGMGEILFILLVIVIMFGPKRLPELAQMVGKGMQKFKSIQAEMHTQVQNIQAEMKANLEVDNPYVIKPSPPRRDQIVEEIPIISISDEENNSDDVIPKKIDEGKVD